MDRVKYLVDIYTLQHAGKASLDILSVPTTPPCAKTVCLIMSIHFILNRVCFPYQQPTHVQKWSVRLSLSVRSDTFLVPTPSFETVCPTRSVWLILNRAYFPYQHASMCYNSLSGGFLSGRPHNFSVPAHRNALQRSI